MECIRVVYVSWAYDQGSGAETSLTGTLRELNRDRIEPFVICPPGAAIAIDARHMGIPAVECKMATWPASHVAGRISFFLTSPIWLAMIRSLRPDVIHCNSVSAGEYGVVASVLLGVPCAVHVRDPGMGRITLQLLKWARRRLSLIYVSRYVASVVAPMVGEPVDQARVMYNIREHYPIDLAARTQVRESLGVREGDLVVCTVGRVTETKGQREFVEAGMSYSGPGSVHWLVIGDSRGCNDPQYYVNLCRLVKQTGNPNVRMLGYRTDARAIIDSADVMVLVSRADPLPGAILEAMYSSKPVIAMRDGSGAAEMVVDGETGYLLAERSAGAIAASVGKLAGDAELRERMGCAANIRLRREFGVQSHISALEKIYAEMLGRKSDVQRDQRS